LISAVLFQTGRQTVADGTIFMAWIVAFLIAAGVLIIVIRPLLAVETASGKVKVRPTNENETILDNLYERLAVAEKSLEELEYDKEVKALTEADYQDLKERYTAKVTTAQTEIDEREHSLQERKQRLAAKRTATKTKPENGKMRDEVKKIIANPATLLASRKEAKETLKCTECATPFKPGEKICSNCKAPLPLICAECGSELEPSNKFCPECGTPAKQ
jgi:Double zinc ribbon